MLSFPVTNPCGIPTPATSIIFGTGRGVGVRFATGEGWTCRVAVAVAVAVTGASVLVGDGLMGIGVLLGGTIGVLVGAGGCVVAGCVAGGVLVATGLPVQSAAMLARFGDPHPVASSQAGP